MAATLYEGGREFFIGDNRHSLTTKTVEFMPSRSRKPPPPRPAYQLQFIAPPSCKHWGYDRSEDDFICWRGHLFAWRLYHVYWDVGFSDVLSGRVGLEVLHGLVSNWYFNLSWTYLLRLCIETLIQTGWNYYFITWATEVNVYCVCSQFYLQHGLR